MVVVTVVFLVREVIVEEDVVADVTLVVDELVCCTIEETSLSPNDVEDTSCADVPQADKPTAKIQHRITAKILRIIDSSYSQIYFTVILSTWPLS